MQFSEDDETKEFLESSREKSDQLMMQLFHSVVKCILSWAMNKTSINGYEAVTHAHIFSFKIYVIHIA